MDQRTEHPSLSETPITTFIGRVSGYAANGLRYWEPRRLIFNIVLGLVVGGHLVAAWPQSWTKLTFNNNTGLLLPSSTRKRVLLRRLCCRSLRSILRSARSMGQRSDCHLNCGHGLRRRYHPLFCGEYIQQLNRNNRRRQKTRPRHAGRLRRSATWTFCAHPLNSELARDAKPRSIFLFSIGGYLAERCAVVVVCGLKR